MNTPHRILGLTAKGCTAVGGRHTLGCVACGARALTELPRGFRKVSVLLTDAEFEELRGDVALSQRGTFSEAIRRRLHMSDSPYGIYAAIARANPSDEE